MEKFQNVSSPKCKIISSKIILIHFLCNSRLRVKQQKKRTSILFLASALANILHCTPLLISASFDHSDAIREYAVAQVFDALHCKPEGRGYLIK